MARRKKRLLDIRVWDCAIDMVVREGITKDIITETAIDLMKEITFHKKKDQSYRFDFMGYSLWIKYVKEKSRLYDLDTYEITLV